MKLSVILLCLLCNFAILAQNEYSFFVAGHTYGSPGVNNVGLHPPFKAKFDYINSRPKIKFGVLTGDIVSPNPTAQDWDEVDGDINAIGLPVYFAVGNHDMENRPLFESRYGDTYYHFLFQDDLFIVLDPNLDGWSILGEQLLYLQNTVKDNAPIVENIYLFFHQVLWKDGNDQYNYIVPNSSDGRIRPVNFWTEVEPLFSCLSNDVFMFAGDLGAGSWGTDVMYDSYKNIRLIGSGMGGPEGDNFIVVNVANDKAVTYNIICLTENVNCLGELTDYQISEPNRTIHVCPNPVEDHLIIQLNSSIQTNIELFNLSSQLLIHKESEGQNQCVLDVSTLPKGFYVLRLSNESGVFSTKIIIQ